MTLAGAPPASSFLRPSKPSPIVTLCLSSRFSRSTAHSFPSLQTKNSIKSHGTDSIGEGKCDQRLEEEIFEFMRNSKRPDTFPTKRELIEAGRSDLAEAVTSHGGWMTLGWDLETDKGRNGDLRVDFDYQSDFQPTYADFQSEIDLNGAEIRSGVHPDYPEASFSGRSIEEEESTDKGGIEGIIKRVERDRNLLHLSKKSKKRAQNGRDNYTKPQLDPGDKKVSLNNRRPIETKEANNRVKISPLKEEIIGSQNGKFSSGSNGSVRAICDKWTRWSLSRNNSSVNNNIEADETIPTGEGKAIEYTTPKDLSNNINNNNINNNNIDNNNNNNINNNDDEYNINVGPNGSEGIESLTLEREEIHLRLQHLESSLNSSLKSLRSKVKHLLSQNIDEGSSNEVSDDWEFRETEIMKAKTEVRSLRARLSVLEGKMALKLIEAQKLLEENERKFEYNQRAMFGLKTVSVVWPNPANEVLLAGSFDGWTNQRNMKKSKEGLFTLNLTLYPGQYEIKFIVDGVWKVDPLRPVVHNNGHENNLLTV